MSGLQTLKILIADDNASDRMILKAILRRQGHEVIEAEDGQQAVEMYDEHHPGLVLMDVFMPNMDGQQAAWIIKQKAGDELVPIIFLTSLSDAESLADCLDAGGDDFLTKPYNKIILKAKIEAFSRMRALHLVVQEQREHLVQEQTVAKAVFDGIAHHGALDSPNIQYLISPMAIFNGDVMLVARQPSGGMTAFLGDFTGHGLPAAIGTMPLAEVFYGMTQKGFALKDIMREINRKMKSILPVGVFCCANVVDLNFRNRTIEVWSGGMPDNVLYNRSSGEIRVLKSKHLALGVLSEERFKYDPYFFEMDADDVLYLWSDGIPESQNSDGDMFGEERMFDVFRSSEDRSNLFHQIVRRVSDFSGGGPQNDDHTLLEVGMLELEAEEEQPAAEPHETKVVKGPLDWTFDYELRNQSLADFDPLPLLTHILMEVPGLNQQASKVYTILAELYSNALDHGILRLDSRLKQSASGFAEYYRLKSERLTDLQEASIRFVVSHAPAERGGVLTLVVEDSGPGFDYRSATFAHKTEGLSGRGLPLLMSLCQHFEYQGCGNRVFAEFHWDR